MLDPKLHTKSLEELRPYQPVYLVPGNGVNLTSYLEFRFRFMKKQRLLSFIPAASSQ